MQNLTEIVKSSLHGRLDIALIDKITPHIVKGLEKAGAFVPPCKVGDRVYIDPKTWRAAYLFVNYDHIFITKKHYIVGEVVCIIKTRKQNLVKLKAYNQTTMTPEYERYPISAFGKTVFLTREEAEKTLAENRAKGEKK